MPLLLVVVFQSPESWQRTWTFYFYSLRNCGRTCLWINRFSFLITMPVPRFSFRDTASPGSHSYIAKYYVSSSEIPRSAFQNLDPFNLGFVDSCLTLMWINKVCILMPSEYFNSLASSIVSLLWIMLTIGILNYKPNLWFSVGIRDQVMEYLILILVLDLIVIIG